MLGGSRRRQHGDTHLAASEHLALLECFGLHAQKWTVYSTHMLGQVLVCFN